MSNTTLHTVLINRKWIGVLQTYFKTNGIANFKTKRNDYDELKPYEKMFERKLTRSDAIVISPLTKPEINKIITEYHTNDEIYQYQEKESKEQVEIYFRTYGEPDTSISGYPVLIYNSSN